VAAPTVATASLSEDHDTALPVTTLPLASLVVAVACVVLPTPIVEDASDTDTDATAEATTVTGAEPTLPSLVAVMLAVPAPTAVTTALFPLPLTVATAVLSDDHVTTRPVTLTPFASLVVAVAWVVAPRTMLEAASDTVTVATGGTVIVTVADPLCPSLLAMMPAVPVLTAVTTPAADTVATAVLSDDQVMARPVSTVPPASLGIAVAVVVWPTATDVCARETERLATGGGPATPPPPPQPNAAIHKTIAVRAWTGIETPLGMPRLRRAETQYGRKPGTHKPGFGVGHPRGRELQNCY
jgi:hypothetical protein